MFVFDLQAKLKRCNPLLYVAYNGLEYEGIGLAAVWLKKPREFRTKGRLLTKGAARLQAVNAGHVDQMLTAIPYPEVPEYPTLMPNGIGIARKGWRAIVIECVGKGAFSWDKARKVFGAGIGESDFDRLDYLGKERALQREAAGKSWRKD